MPLAQIAPPLPPPLPPYIPRLSRSLLSTIYIPPPRRMSLCFDRLFVSLYIHAASLHDSLPCFYPLPFPLPLPLFLSFYPVCVSAFSVCFPLPPPLFWKPRIRTYDLYLADFRFATLHERLFFSVSFFFCFRQSFSNFF